MDKEAGILVRIKGDETDFQSKLDKAAKKSEQFAKSVSSNMDKALPPSSQVEGYSNNFSGAIGRAATSAGTSMSGFATIAGTVVVGALTAVVAVVTLAAAAIGSFTSALSLGITKYAQFADQLYEQSLSTGVAVDRLMVLNQAFESAGMGANGASAAFSTMQNAVSSAVDESERQNEQLTQMQSTLADLQATTISAPELVDTEALEAEIKKLQFTRIPTPQAMSTRGLRGADLEEARRLNREQSEAVAEQKMRNRERLSELNKQLSQTKKTNTAMLNDYEKTQKSLQSQLKRSQDQISKLQTTGSKKLNAFKSLGLDVLELRNLGPDKIFDRISEAIRKIPDANKRVALARDIFGDSSRGMLSVMVDPDKISLAERMLGSLRANGLETAEQISRAYDILTQKPGILLKQLGAGFMKAVYQSQTLRGALEKFVDLDFGPLGEKIGTIARDLFVQVTEWMKKFTGNDQAGQMFADLSTRASNLLSTGIANGIVEGGKMAFNLFLSMGNGSVKEFTDGMQKSLIGSAIMFGESLYTAFQVFLVKMEYDLSQSAVGRVIGGAAKYGNALVAGPASGGPLVAVADTADYLANGMTAEERDARISEIQKRASEGSIGRMFLERGVNQQVGATQRMMGIQDPVSNFVPTPGISTGFRDFNRRFGNSWFDGKSGQGAGSSSGGGLSKNDNPETVLTLKEIAGLLKGNLTAMQVA